MNILDFIIAGCLLLAFFVGWKLKALNLLGMTLSLLAGIWLANHFHTSFLGLYHNFPAVLRHSLAWITVFLAVAVTISILFTMLAKAFEIVRLQWLDHLLGAVLALVVMLGLLMIAATVTDTASRLYGWKIVERSRLAPALVHTARPLIQKGLHRFPRLKQSLP